MKESALALYGGPTAVDIPGPHFTWPQIEDRDRQAVAAQLDTAVSIPDRSGVVAALEDELASYLGVRHVVTTCTGTAALHSMYAAAGIGPGDEVMVPALTFHATATPLFHLGARPILADVTGQGQIDLDAADRIVTAQTKAIIAVHLWGIPEDMDALRSFADRHGLILFEDGSHATGATWKGQRVGSFGSASAFSLNGPKPLSAGEGGFVATDDTELYYRVLLHGQYNKRCRRGDPGRPPACTLRGHRHGPEAPHPPARRGTRPRPAGAAGGPPRQPTGDAQRMLTALDGIPGIQVPKVAPEAAPSWYALPLYYDQDALGGLPLQRFMDAVQAEGGVEADLPGSTCPLHAHPLFQRPGSLLPGYADHQGPGEGDFPVADQVHATTLKLPVWHRQQDIAIADAYTTAISKVARHAKDVMT